MASMIGKVVLRVGLVLLGPLAGYLLIHFICNAMFGRTALIGPIVYGYAVGLLIAAYWGLLFWRWTA